MIKMNFASKNSLAWFYTIKIILHMATVGFPNGPFGINAQENCFLSNSIFATPSFSTIVLTLYVSIVVPKPPVWFVATPPIWAMMIPICEIWCCCLLNQMTQLAWKLWHFSKDFFSYSNQYFEWNPLMSSLWSHQGP